MADRPIATLLQLKSNRPLPKSRTQRGYGYKLERIVLAISRLGERGLLLGWNADGVHQPTSAGAESAIAASYCFGDGPISGTRSITSSQGTVLRPDMYDRGIYDGEKCKECPRTNVGMRQRQLFAQYVALYV